MSDTGFVHLRGFMTASEISRAIEIMREVAKEHPLVRPSMPNGDKFHLTLMNFGQWGWWADSKGYRYIDHHPTTSKPLPPIPDFLLNLCERILGETGHFGMRIENLLVNHYSPNGSLGLHIDRTEKAQQAPIVSLSIGADALFILAGEDRTKGKEYVLSSGDVCVQGGRSRRWYHGIKKILPTINNPLKDGGRLNFTFRQVMP